MDLEEYINKIPKSFAGALVFVLVLLIGAVDYLTGGEAASSILYLLPVGISSWYISRRHALFVSVLSGLIWLSADIIERTSYIHPLIHLWNFLASFGIFLIFSFLMSWLRDSLNNERLLARTDYLTSLPNRRASVERAEIEMKRIQRFGHPFTMAYIDIDNFKTVNDTFGHKTGDMLLHSVAVTMQNFIRETDVAGRLGGDEFILMMPETDYQQAQTVFVRLRAQLQEIMQKNNYAVTFSIGAITFHESPASVAEMISKVDEVMYSVKNIGRNNIKHELFGDGLEKIRPA